MNSNSNWKPFALFAVLIGVLIVFGFGLMILLSGANAGGNWGPGVWGPGVGGMGFFWIFPVFGFAMMLVMMFFFFIMMGRQGGPMGGFPNNPPLEAHPYQADVRPVDLRCPSCNAIVQPDWNVCPHCGASLRSDQKSVSAHDLLDDQGTHKEIGAHQLLDS